MRNYIFDLDGTLINSSDEVLACFEKAFAQANYEIDKTKLTHNLIGPPLKDIIKAIAPNLSDENKIEEITQNFRNIYDFEDNDISYIYEGVYDVLEFLKANKANIFMATFKPMQPTLRIIKQFNLNYFEAIYTIDMFDFPITKEYMIKDIVSKYNLKKEETLMVGDALSDIIAAKNAGVWAVAALWGYGDNKKPLLEKADCCLDNITELKTFLAKGIINA